MTHTQTIADLAKRRREVISAADRATQQYDSCTIEAAAHAEALLEYREQAEDYSAMLRQLDPEHAEDYPDPAVSVPAVSIVSALRNLADQLAVMHLPACEQGGVLDVSLHGVRADLAASLGEEMAGLRAGAKLKQHATWLTVAGLGENEADTNVRITVYFSDEPVPVSEPFAKAMPDEAAEAFESCAARGAELAAAEDTRT